MTNLPIRKIVIHCSDTPNGRPHTAEHIHVWHKERDNPFDGIGYHYVIRVDGVIENGRPEFWQGAHASGHNKNSIGICMIGTDEYSLDQWMALSELVNGILARYPESKVIGHNEVSNKICPGFDVQYWLRNKRYRSKS